MDILKYFYEEPAALDVLTPDDEPDARSRKQPVRSLAALLEGPRYYRGYLAGTNLATGHVGLTALAHPDAFIEPLLTWLDGAGWQVGRSEGAATPCGSDSVRSILDDPGDAVLLIHGGVQASAADVQALAGARRAGLPTLRRLLDAGGVVLFPEPAHHGFDWSFFSPRPAREALVAAMRGLSPAGVRRFVLPYAKARSEEKFYFETWLLEAPALPAHIEEL